ncbi:GIY-YIG nuclease family protein [Patescibacteria group bacterium]|nr:GIY-YIG nuclease family protein [Patescibacteria group bacterium]
MNKEYYVYILTNQNNNVMYIGVTGDLINRIKQHKNKDIIGFTKPYNVIKLVYYEVYQHMHDAICREKQLKNWHRDWKNNLVESVNKKWEDISDDFL